MAKSRNRASGIFSELSRTKPDGSKGNSAFSPTNLVGQAEGSQTEKLAELGRSLDANSSSINAKATPEGIKFGRPSSQSSGKTSSSGNEWASLLKQTASGGIASAFTGSFGGIGGLGALVSGIVGLFGGGGNKNTPPPLVQFQLPSSQQQTIYVGSQGSRDYQGSVVLSSTGSGIGNGTYNSGTTETSASASTSQWFQEQSGQIAQAVKTAILNSSSLNDVISDI